MYGDEPGILPKAHVVAQIFVYNAFSGLSVQDEPLLRAVRIENQEGVRSTDVVYVLGSGLRGFSAKVHVVG